MYTSTSKVDGTLSRAYPPGNRKRDDRWQEITGVPRGNKRKNGEVLCCLEERRWTGFRGSSWLIHLLSHWRIENSFIHMDGWNTRGATILYSLNKSNFLWRSFLLAILKILVVASTLIPIDYCSRYSSVKNSFFFFFAWRNSERLTSPAAAMVRNGWREPTLTNQCVEEELFTWKLRSSAWKLPRAHTVQSN